MISIRAITFNGFILIGVGLFLIYYGVTLILLPSERLHGAGFLLSGAASVIFGATNGFTDMSPLGRWLAKLAIIAYIIGLPIIAFYLYSVIGSD